MSVHTQIFKHMYTVLIKSHLYFDRFVELLPEEDHGEVEPRRQPHQKGKGAEVINKYMNFI